eukprot:gnl/MRDRNA2_/MRDRNA2_102169_c0_seq1.p1 gnl/MRDRNA2_/MRDRNA2_102169_c0~~gnl/MRDRNA2_/MRDRNA2_102169_c0_seq1.p1  ORF type:complete len:1221 (+),score=308.00 gnl/MRDRNA2_/MRDRNA2_102169_c0_seq1:85-3747(+)
MMPTTRSAGSASTINATGNSMIDEWVVGTSKPSRPQIPSCVSGETDKIEDAILSLRKKRQDLEEKRTSLQKQHNAGHSLEEFRDCEDNSHLDAQSVYLMHLCTSEEDKCQLIRQAEALQAELEDLRESLSAMKEAEILNAEMLVEQKATTERARSSELKALDEMHASREEALLFKELTELHTQEMQDQMLEIVELHDYLSEERVEFALAKQSGKQYAEEVQGEAVFACANQSVRDERVEHANSLQPEMEPSPHAENQFAKRLIVATTYANDPGKNDGIELTKYMVHPVIASASPDASSEFHRKPCPIYPMDHDETAPYEETFFGTQADDKCTGKESPATPRAAAFSQGEQHEASVVIELEKANKIALECSNSMKQQRDAAEEQVGRLQSEFCEREQDVRSMQEELEESKQSLAEMQIKQTKAKDGMQWQHWQQLQVMQKNSYSQVENLESQVSLLQCLKLDLKQRLEAESNVARWFHEQYASATLRNGVLERDKSELLQSMNSLQTQLQESNFHLRSLQDAHMRTLESEAEVAHSLADSLVLLEWKTQENCTAQDEAEQAELTQELHSLRQQELKEAAVLQQQKDEMQKDRVAHKEESQQGIAQPQVDVAMRSVSAVQQQISNTVQVAEEDEVELEESIHDLKSIFVNLQNEAQQVIQGRQSTQVHEWEQQINQLQAVFVELENETEQIIACEEVKQLELVQKYEAARQKDLAATEHMENEMAKVAQKEKAQKLQMKELEEALHAAHFQKEIDKCVEERLQDEIDELQWMYLMLKGRHKQVVQDKEEKQKELICECEEARKEEMNALGNLLHEGEQALQRTQEKQIEIEELTASILAMRKDKDQVLKVAADVQNKMDSTNASAHVLTVTNGMDRAKSRFEIGDIHRASTTLRDLTTSKPVCVKYGTKLNYLGETVGSLKKRLDEFHITIQSCQASRGIVKPVIYFKPKRLVKITQLMEGLASEQRHVAEELRRLHALPIITGRSHTSGAVPRSFMKTNPKENELPRCKEKKVQPAHSPRISPRMHSPRGMMTGSTVSKGLPGSCVVNPHQFPMRSTFMASPREVVSSSCRCSRPHATIPWTSSIQNPMAWSPLSKIARTPSTGQSSTTASTMSIGASPIQPIHDTSPQSSPRVLTGSSLSPQPVVSRCLSPHLAAVVDRRCISVLERRSGGVVDRKTIGALDRRSLGATAPKLQHLAKTNVEDKLLQRCEKENSCPQHQK